MKLEGVERRGDADPIELVKKPLDNRKRHGVDIDQLSLAQA